MLNLQAKQVHLKQLLLILAIALSALLLLLLLSPKATGKSTAFNHSPVNPVRTPGGTALRNKRDQLYSTNWSGYVVAKYATATNYTSASATWIVPAVTASSTYTNGYSSSWVGIGGFCLNSTCTKVDKSLIQLGTEQDYTSSGTVYYAWYEVLPKAEQLITSLTVNPGDTIQASLKEVTARNNGSGGAKSQVWQLSLTDVTSGQSWSQQINYNSTLASAEWIQEAPYSGGILPLADYGTATFDPGTANNGNPGLTWPADSIIMTNTNGQTSNPSSPDSDTDGFNTCWGAGTTLTACTPPSSKP